MTRSPSCIGEHGILSLELKSLSSLGQYAEWQEEQDTQNRFLTHSKLIA
jgi:hypothetical protein